jgi:hypothetical protein
VSFPTSSRGEGDNAGGSKYFLGLQYVSGFASRDFAAFGDVEYSLSKLKGDAHRHFIVAFGSSV